MFTLCRLRIDSAPGNSTFTKIIGAYHVLDSMNSFDSPLQ
jgi:hypothetical protein